MPVFEWNINYMTGIREIDQHHQRLVGLLNESYSECKQGMSAEKVTSLIDELIDYADYHFSCEERLMEEASYPDLPLHKREHELFTNQVREFQKGHQENKLPPISVLSFISNWITHHIQQTDVKFGVYMDSRKIRRSPAHAPKTK
jgi:hemerythrin